MLDELFTEWTRLTELQNDTQIRLNQVGAAIETLQVLAAEEHQTLIKPGLLSDEESGFTDKVREILKANPFKRLTALEIRDVLMKQTPKEDPKIVLIHTHNTLKRLHKQEEVEETKISDGRTAYQWQAPQSNSIASWFAGDAVKTPAEAKEVLNKALQLKQSKERNK